MEVEIKTNDESLQMDKNNILNIAKEEKVLFVRLQFVDIPDPMLLKLISI